MTGTTILKPQLNAQHLAVRFAIGAMRFAMNQLAEARPRGMRSRAEIIAGVRCEWVWVRSVEPSQYVTLYLHGGGYVSGSPESHFMLAKLLSRASDSRVLLVDYRLAPAHQYPAQLDDALAVYCALLERGIDTKNLALAGDSAGGNLSLALMLRLRELNLPLPAAFVSYSPWTDLTHSGDSITQNAKRDTAIPVVILGPLASIYAAEHDLRDPLISPLFGDYTGLPPMQLHVADGEVFRDDTLRLVENVRKAGGEVESRVWKNMFHAFPVFAKTTRAGRVAIKQSGAFLRTHFTKQNLSKSQTAERKL
jgi:epsilon-lactone hydrolase